MDPHRLAEERSLAYHRRVADILARDSTLLDETRARVRGWLEGGPVPEVLARKWVRVLERPVAEVVEAIVEDSEAARELRQVSPFAGLIKARERWRIWRDVRDRQAGAP